MKKRILIALGIIILAASMEQVAGITTVIIWGL